MMYKLQIKIGQYNFDHYSEMINSKIVIVDSEKGSGEFFFSGARWVYSVERNEIDSHPSGSDLIVHVEVVEGFAKECNVVVQVVVDNWSCDNYVLMPSAAYKGNRFESRRS